MANVTDPRAISFCNKRLRTTMDALAQAYYAAKVTMQEYYAENLGQYYPADPSAKIEDAAFNGDGRKVIDGNMVLNAVTRCSEIVADMEAGGNAKLNTILSVSVNPVR